MTSGPRPPPARVLVLGGPTASGKSALAAAWAAAVGGAVVSADSRQVYRGMEVGTAQPEAALRRQAPHFLLGFLSPRAPYSAGAYGSDARKTIAALVRRGLPVVLCGGTGLYLRAVLEGVPPLEPTWPRRRPESGRERARDAVAARRRRRDELLERWSSEGGGAMHAALARVDPALAARLHVRDRQRILRGLEFHAEYGRPLSELWSSARSMTEIPGMELDTTAVPRFWLDVPLAELERAIDFRVERMLERGLVREARALFERYGDQLPVSLNAVGYPELFAHFRGEVGLTAALETIRLRSRQYAKRQRTWFRNQDRYTRLPAGERALATLQAAARGKGGTA